jgi:hypothetical protein
MRADGTNSNDYPRFICINKECSRFASKDFRLKVWRRVRVSADGKNIYDSGGEFIEQEIDSNKYEFDENAQTFCGACDDICLDAAGLSDAEILGYLL